MGVEVGSPPRQPSGPPPRPSTSSLVYVPVSPPPHCLASPAQTGACPARAGLASLARSQGSCALFEVSASSMSPPGGTNPAVGLPVPVLMPVCLCHSVLGLPGPASGGLGLGVQPPPAAHAAAHLPGGGPLLHQQAQAGRVAGTLEKGGEVPSGLGPSRSLSVGNQMLASVAR